MKFEVQYSNYADGKEAKERLALCDKLINASHAAWAIRALRREAGDSGSIFIFALKRGRFEHVIGLLQCDPNHEWGSNPPAARTAAEFHARYEAKLKAEQ